MPWLNMASRSISGYTRLLRAFGVSVIVFVNSPVVFSSMGDDGLHHDTLAGGPRLYLKLEGTIPVEPTTIKSLRLPLNKGLGSGLFLALNFTRTLEFSPRPPTGLPY